MKHKSCKPNQPRKLRAKCKAKRNPCPRRLPGITQQSWPRIRVPPQASTAICAAWLSIRFGSLPRALPISHLLQVCRCCHSLRRSTTCAGLALDAKHHLRSISATSWSQSHNAFLAPGCSTDAALAEAWPVQISARTRVKSAKLLLSHSEDGRTATGANAEFRLKTNKD